MSKRKSKILELLPKSIVIINNSKKSCNVSHSVKQMKYNAMRIIKEKKWKEIIGARKWSIRSIRSNASSKHISNTVAAKEMHLSMHYESHWQSRWIMFNTPRRKCEPRRPLCRHIPRPTLVRSKSGRPISTMTYIQVKTVRFNYAARLMHVNLSEMVLNGCVPYGVRFVHCTI